MQLTNGTRVLHNFTLLSTICSYSETKDILCIMRTSRLAFSITASRIWRSLEGVEPLLMLLSPILEFDDEEDSLLVKLPGRPTSPDTDFTRFKSYNTLVQELVITYEWNFGGRHANRFRLQYWSGLFPEAQCVPLLPNLCGLTIAEGFPDDADEVVFWLSALISPSLSTLNIYPTLAFHNTATALGLLAQNALQLRKLKHKFNILSSKYDHTSINRSVASQLVLSPLACGQLRNSQNLVCLQVQGYFVSDKILSALSCLPRLQQLAIDNIWNPINRRLTRTFQNACLPEDSFPAIQQLQLDSQVLDDFMALWSIVPLVSGLKTITLKSVVVAPGTLKPIFSEDVLANLLPCISNFSPHTERLTLDSAILLDDKPAAIGLNSSSWAHIAQLPLSHLKLECFRADSEWFKDAR
ncbi:hypothetical protein FRC09_000692, partial [Ceratobasidium sp. 395]